MQRASEIRAAGTWNPTTAIDKVVLDADEPRRDSNALFDLVTHVVFSAEGLRATAGTDSLGRDILSRLLWGARVAAVVAVASAVISALIGVPVASQSTRPIQRSRFSAYHLIVSRTPSSHETFGSQPVSAVSFSWPTRSAITSLAPGR